MLPLKIELPRRLRQLVSSTEMWTFFPVLPTKAAWEGRLFKEHFTKLDDLQDFLKEKKFIFPGQIVLRELDEKGMNKTKMFSGLRELRDTIKENKWTQAEIQKIWFYHIGWWSWGGRL